MIEKRLQHWTTYLPYLRQSTDHWRRSIRHRTDMEAEQQASAECLATMVADMRRVHPDIQHVAPLVVQHAVIGVTVFFTDGWSEDYYIPGKEPPRHAPNPY